MIIKAILKPTGDANMPMRHDDGLFHFTYSVWKILTNSLLFVNVIMWGQLVRPDTDHEKERSQSNNRMIAFVFVL